MHSMISTTTLGNGATIRDFTVIVLTTQELEQLMDRWFLGTDRNDGESIALMVTEDATTLVNNVCSIMEAQGVDVFSAMNEEGMG